jgi:hypothetical protein
MKEIDCLKDSLFGFDFTVNYLIYCIEWDITSLGIHGKIILKMDIYIYVGRMLARSVRLRIGCSGMLL